MAIRVMIGFVFLQGVHGGLEDPISGIEEKLGGEDKAVNKDDEQKPENFEKLLCSVSEQVCRTTQDNGIVDPDDGFIVVPNQCLEGSYQVKSFPSAATKNCPTNWERVMVADYDSTLHIICAGCCVPEVTYEEIACLDCGGPDVQDATCPSGWRRGTPLAPAGGGFCGTDQVDVFRCHAVDEGPVCYGSYVPNTDWRCGWSCSGCSGTKADSEGEAWPEWYEDRSLTFAFQII